MRTRMYYVDDSGAGETGYAVFSWITCDITAWRTGLAAWLALRRRFFVDYQIPPSYELHATLFVNGRGRPSLDAEWNASKSKRADAVQLALETIGRCRELGVGTAYRRFGKARELGLARADLYRALVADLECRLAAADELGLVLMDGDGVDPGYAAAHRGLSLRHRRMIEDPLFRVSHQSQWIQMADLVAYCAYQSLLRHPGKQFLWDWYEQHIQRHDPASAPREL